jgi:hypothetical protein
LGANVVGIAFQCLTGGDGVGYVIPVPVISHFLKDLERHGNQYTGALLRCAVLRCASVCC